jgi:hypothetical protein
MAVTSVRRPFHGGVIYGLKAAECYQLGNGAPPLFPAHGGR